MTSLQDIIPQQMYEILCRSGIISTKQIITLSTWDIKKLTNLCSADIIYIKNVVAESLHPTIKTCDMLMIAEKDKHVRTGCNVVDSLLGGGFRKGTLTEIYGESGVGKTQLVLQAAAYNKGCVYICTEGPFPIKRLNQIITCIPNYKPDTDNGSNIFVEHITESHELLSCIRVRLPKLLERKSVPMIIIDSVAAPFRCEDTNYIQRAEQLRECAITLINVAQQYNLASICINQVTDNFEVPHNILPSLGLAWSNMVSTRCSLKKSKEWFDLGNMKNSHIKVRKLSVTFAPNLPNSSATVVITSRGIESMKT